MSSLGVARAYNRWIYASGSRPRYWGHCSKKGFEYNVNDGRICKHKFGHKELISDGEQKDYIGSRW